MSTDDVRRKIEQEQKEAQEQKEKRRREYLALPTVEEWDRVVVDFAKKIFHKLFPESWSSPKIIERMKYWEGYLGGTSTRGMPSHHNWKFFKEGTELSFSVYQTVPFDWPEREEKNPRRVRGKLWTYESNKHHSWRSGGQMWVPYHGAYDHGVSFSSPDELEAAFDDIFEYLLTEKK